MTKKFLHLKTGDTYEMLRDDVINCTNANDLIFVREKEEFYQKFKEKKEA